MATCPSLRRICNVVAVRRRRSSQELSDGITPLVLSHATMKGIYVLLYFTISLGAGESVVGLMTALCLIALLPPG